MVQIFLLVFSIYPSYACTCPPSRLSDIQKEEIKNSDFIFIGEVSEIDSSNNTYKVRVLESLSEGDNEGTVFTGKNWESCSPFVDSKGKWLIYGKMKEDYLRVNLCGISRSFENPEKVINSVLAPLPNENESKKEYNLRREKWKIENQEKSKEDLMKEINSLRERIN